MNYRQRVIQTITFQPVDELPFRHAYGLMPGVLEDWYQQGLPSSVKTEEDIYTFFGFPTRPKPLPLNVGFDPPFETRIIEDTAEYQIAVDFMGRRTKLLKEYASLPLPLGFPVRDLSTWQEYKRRLNFSPTRVADNFEKVVNENIAAGKINSFGTMGFYWLPRDLMGDENLCLAYYEQPDLVRDILETWCGLIEQVLGTALERVTIDCIHFGEDMAYRNGSMVGKSIFDEFIKPYYLRVYKLIERYKIPIFSVDTDGYTGELIEWFNDCGVNLIGPNEVRAGNDIMAYRRRFGHTIAYDGGLDKLVLPQGQDAINDMLNRIIPFVKETGGGWIVCLDHRVVKGTSLKNFEYYINRVRQMAVF